MAESFRAWPGSQTSEEDEKKKTQGAYYPGPLPGSNPDRMGALRDESFNAAVGLLDEWKTTRGILPGDPVAPTGGGGGTPPPVEEDGGQFRAWPEATTAEEEDERGFISNTARLAGQRALDLVGSGLKAAGKAGEFLDDLTGAGQFVWGDGEGFRYLSKEEFEIFKEGKVGENLLTETLPMAFQDRDLGGEKRHSPEAIKQAWAEGDVSGLGKATAAFIFETGIESIPDMIAAVYSLPSLLGYVGARSVELGEERVRNERLSEVLAEGEEVTAENYDAVKKATGYVTADELTPGTIATAAPFAALSSLLERVGALGIGKAGSEVAQQVAGEAAQAGMRNVLKEGAKAGGKEATTEFFQEGVIEYLAETVGTSGEGLFANVSVAEGAERGAFGALAGGGFGATAGTGIAALRSLAAPGSDTEAGDTPTPGPTAPPSTEDTSIDNMSEAERTALTDQLDTLEGETATGTDGLTQAERELETPPPQAEQATTPTPPLAEAPQPAAGEPTIAGTPPTIAEQQQGQAVSEPGGPMVEIPAAPVEAAPVEETEVITESPMIQRKALKEQFDSLAKKVTKEGMPGFRKAVRELGGAINSIFPEAKLPSLKGGIGPKRMAEYFATLDEEVVIDETLPNLKGYLEQVTAAPDAATAVQALNTLRDYVANSGAGVVAPDAATPFLEQSSKGVTAYEAFEAKRKAGEKKYTATIRDKKTGKKKKVERVTNRSPQNKPYARAVAIDELATTVNALVEKAAGMGLNVPAEVSDLIRRARVYRERAQVAKTRIDKGGAGSKKVDWKFNRDNLNEVGGKLREAAKSLTEQVATVDTSTKKVSSTTPKKAKATAKVESRSAVTEAPAKPKKETAGEKAKATSKKKAKVKINDLRAKKTEDLTYNELRRVAKHLGIKAVGKKADLIEAVNAWNKKYVDDDARTMPEIKAGVAKEDAAAAKSEAKVTTKKPKKIADPDKVIEVETTGPVLTGRQAAAFGEDMAVEGGVGVVDRALTEAGIPKKTAATVKAIIQKAPASAERKIIQALKDYRGPADNLNLTATIFEAVGGQIDPNAIAEMVEFAESHAKNKTLDPAESEIRAREEAIREQAELEGRSFEDMQEILEDTGLATQEQEDSETPWSDPYQDMSVDEWENSQYVTEETLPQGGLNDSTQLTRALLKKDGFLSFLSSFTKIRGVTDPGPTTVNDVLDAIIKVLPANNRYVPLARRLRQLNLDVPVYVYEEAPRLKSGGKVLGSYYPGTEFDTAKRQIRLYVDNREGSGTNPTHVFASALHEIVHAATVAAYETDSEFKAELDRLYDRAVLEMDRMLPSWRTDGTANLREFYGLSNAKEFIAEALTNPDFQMFLSEIDSVNNRTVSPAAKIKGLMRDFVNSIKKYFGYSIRNSLLEDVIILADSNLKTEEEVLIAQQKQQVGLRRNREADQGPTASYKVEGQSLEAQARDDIAGSVENTKLGIVGMAKSIGKAARGAGNQLNLAISGRDAIERENRGLFDRAAEALGIKNPLTAFDRAKNRSQTMVRKFEEKAAKLLKDFSNLTNEARSVSQMMMRDVTMANIDPTQPLNSKANAHIWTKGGKKQPPRVQKKYKDKAIKARNNWIAFAKKYPAAAKVVKRMAALAKEIHDTKVEYALTALGEAFEFDTATTKALGQVKTSADVDALIDPKEVETATAVVEKKGQKKDKKKAAKQALAEAQARAQAAKSAKTILRESSIKGWYFPLRRYGEYVVSTGPDVTGDDRYTSFHETAAEAELIAARINETASEENKVKVSLKLRANATRGAMSDVMTDLERRIPSGETRDRLRGAMAEVLAANSAYQSQLKRQNVDGVASKDMARAFEEYVHVSKYTLGDIRMAHQFSEALKGILRIARNAEEMGLTQEEAYQAGRVQRELATRNKAEGGERKKNRAQKVIGMLGFLNFLGAPSYWALNLTQTYVVTIPYLAAKFGEVKGPAALFRAQKQVFKAVFEAMESGEKNYEGFKAKLPDATRKLVEQLEADLVLQSTIAHEFGDIMDPRGFKRMRNHALTRPVAKGAEFAMMLMERIPESIEHYNRISTALATYELSGGDYNATRDAVNLTQMNYDTNNRARLLKQLPGQNMGGTTPYITPVMMFKTFGVGMLKLFYGAAMQAAVKEGGREEGMKLAGYLMATHTLAGGVAGGIMVAPIAAIVYAINSALEPDDEWDLEEMAAAMGKELGGDTLATLFEKGLPAAALGIDMSRSINLGNLIWMGNDSLDYTEWGDLERGAFQVFGPVAQYASNSVREGLRLVSGDPRGGLLEFAQAIVPVKAVRGTLQGIEYETTGIETGSELNLLSPEEFSAFLRTAMGFQATQKTNIRNEYYRDQKLETRRADRKSTLMVKANNAIRDGNWKQLNSILEEMTSYNMSVPEAKYRVTSGDIARLRSRRRTSQREFDRRYRYSD